MDTDFLACIYSGGTIPESALYVQTERATNWSLNNSGADPIPIIVMSQEWYDSHFVAAQADDFREQTHLYDVTTYRAGDAREADIVENTSEAERSGAIVVLRLAD